MVKELLRTMELFVKYMAIAINNLLTTFNPEIIVLNSSFTMNFPDAVQDIHAHIHKKWLHTAIWYHPNYRIQPYFWEVFISVAENSWGYKIPGIFKHVLRTLHLIHINDVFFIFS